MNNSQINKLQQNRFPLIKAKFPSKCTLTGLPVAVGEMVFYNPELKTVQKAIKVYANAQGYSKTDNYLFKIMEAIFNDWIEYQPRDTKEQYFGSFEEMNGGSYLSKKGAIIGEIESVIDMLAEEELDWCWLNNADVPQTFNP